MGFIATKCPQCGADVQLDGSREFGFCNYCGTKIVQDKVVVEHKGSVLVDDSRKIDNLYLLARRARDDNNSEKAAQYYDMVLQLDPNSWEANFYTVYFQSLTCKINEIESAAIRIKNCEDTVINLIKDNYPDRMKREEALVEMSIRIISISNLFYNASADFYNGIDLSIRTRYIQELVDRVYAAKDICYGFGDCVISTFGDDYNKIAVPCWKEGIDLHSRCLKFLDNKEYNRNIILTYVKKIQKFEPSFNPPNISTSSSGCYIATSVYGSYDCPEVWALRRFRDYSLAQTWYGRLFIYFYYAISPKIVKWFGNTSWFKRMCKKKLDQMVEKLRNKGYEDTPYNDRY